MAYTPISILHVEGSNGQSFVVDTVRQLAELVGAERCSILLLDGTALHHAAAVGLPRSYLSAIDGATIGPQAGSCGTAAFTGETCVTRDIQADPAWEGFRELAAEAGLRSCWSVPLKLPDGTVLGTFAKYSDEVCEPTREQIELTEAYASIVALGLDNANRHAELARSYESAASGLAEELEVLNAVRAVTTVASNGVEPALAEIASRAARVLSCEFGAVVVDGDGPARVGWSDRGWQPSDHPAELRELLMGLARQLRATGEDSLLIQDTSEHDEVASLNAVAIGSIAVLVTAHAQSSPRDYTVLCRRIARSLADGAEVVIRRSLAQEKLAHENATLERRASTDPLTGVGNRGGWDAAIADAQVELAGGAATVAVAVFDLDGLKAINDRHGHQGGDDVLCAFASILQRQARATDFVARIGGDEFAVLLRDCDAADARAWCGRALAAIAAHNEAGGEFPIEVSWGSASAGAFSSVAAAFEAADQALYGVKANGVIQARSEPAGAASKWVRRLNSS